MKKQIKPPHTDQHIIPNFYLKAWGDKSLINSQTKEPFKRPHIWIYNKSDNTCDHYPTKTNFTKEDFYTLYDDAGERDLTIEHAFDKVEIAFSWIRGEKLLKNEILTEDEHAKVCLFMAKMHSRTESRLDHISNMLNPVMDKMNDMIEFSKTATTEQLKAMSHISSSSNKTGSYTELKNTVENPLTEIMVPFIDYEAEQLVKLDFAIYHTNELNTFITSDNPCIWHDAEAYKRPPLYQSPALIYDTIEIILPISPTHCLMLNRQGINGYIDISSEPDIVQAINRIIYSHSDKKFITNNDKFNKDVF